MIHDGPREFKNSCVHFQKFRTFELQQWFAYLRELELVLQEDQRKFAALGDVEVTRLLLEKFSKEVNFRLIKTTIELQIVQKHLCYMVGSDNIDDDAEAIERRRRGFEGDTPVKARRKKERAENSRKWRTLKKTLDAID